MQIIISYNYEASERLVLYTATILPFQQKVDGDACGSYSILAISWILYPHEKKG